MIDKIEYNVIEVCSDPWAQQVSRYWSFVGKLKPCYVLLGTCDLAEILLIGKESSHEGQVYGLLFNNPAKFPKIRNFIWHEVGHIKSQKTDDPVECEFSADKWAVEESVKRGYWRIVDEIIFRCLDFLSLEEDSVYFKSSKRIISHFYGIVEERDIIGRYKKKLKI